MILGLYSIWYIDSIKTYFKVKNYEKTDFYNNFRLYVVTKM